jgi:hypothetical protein
MGTLHLWDAFQPAQRRNIAIYVIGIMLYKFGIECEYDESTITSSLKD